MMKCMDEQPALEIIVKQKIEAQTDEDAAKESNRGSLSSISGDCESDPEGDKSYGPRIKLASH